MEGEQAQEMGECEPASCIRKGGAGHMVKGAWEADAMEMLSHSLGTLLSERNKNNNKQVGPNQTYKLLHSKGHNKQNEKTTYRMGENTCE